MPQAAPTQSATQKRVWRKVLGFDWALIVLVVVFCVVVGLELRILSPNLLLALTRSSQSSTFSQYENALRTAAIKTPAAENVALRTLDSGTPKVLVATFGFPALKTGEQTLGSEKWVALPDDLKKACAGRPDSIRALQHILGLPPTRGERVVYEMTVNGADILRPCMSGLDPTTPRCSFELPKPPDEAPAAPAATATTEERETAHADLRESYDRLSKAYRDLRFVSEHMWKSYRTGFARDHAMPGDYLYDGYPFTGMGWTYNWDPESTTSVGVSEFVVPKGARVTVERTISPEEFCGQTNTP